MMSGLIKALPLYVWLVALPQLTSRICHPHQETQGQIQHILTRLTCAYPQQVCHSAIQRSAYIPSCLPSICRYALTWPANQVQLEDSIEQ